jgi:pimeloyl-ACP methyl ester carboxylesterase
VLDSLKLERPVLVGHSIAGEELSSIGSRHPDRVAGLVYLDAAAQYSFDNGKGTTFAEHIAELHMPVPQKPSATDLVSYTALANWWERTRGFKPPEALFRQGRRTGDDGKPGEQLTPPSIPKMILDGTAKFKEIHVPVLALCAMPEALSSSLWSPDVLASAESFVARYNIAKEKQLKEFEEGIPNARVVRIRNANHYIFITNESEVLREMRSFLSTLK